MTNTNDNLVASLRQAILDANAGDVIVFQIPTSDPGYNATNSTWTITLTTGQLSVASSVTIDGGGRKITIQRSTAGGTPNFSVFFINASNVTLTGLTIANGNAAGTPGGGGIVHQSGTLLVRNCTLTGNNGGPSGGGILNNPSTTLQVSNCTFAGNTSSSGGGISNAGILEVNSSTIVGNSGGMFSSGGIMNSGGTAHVRNTIIAGNSGDIGAQDVSGSFVSDGYNFIGIGSSMQGFGLPGSHDQVGVNGFPANPQLGPLQDNSGPTQTRAPSVGSPVIDQGSSGGLGSDQRDRPRPIDQSAIANAGGGDGSDIGAVEVGLPQTGPTFTVTNTADRATGACTVDDCSLRDALNLSNAAPDANVINFAPGLTGTITNGSSQGGLTINSPLTINGPGARLLSVSGDGSNRVFFVASSNVVISGLTITLGGPPAPASAGGIYNGEGGSLTLRDCAITVCIANDAFGGAGIFNDTGTTLVLTRCTLIDNSTSRAGGAVYNLGTFTATNCTFSRNTALNGGAIISKANSGNSSTALRNCTIFGNVALDANQSGGGVYAEGTNTQFHLANTIIAGNVSGGTNPDIRGNVTSDGFNFIGKVGSASGLTNGVNGDQVGGGAGINPNLDVQIRDNGGPTNTVALLSPSSAINAGNDALAPATDQRGYLRASVSDIGAFEFGGTLPTPTPTPPSTSLANISTRLPVQTGDNALIGGFIVTGTQPKKVIVRAIGPSLPVPGKLANPTLELHGPGGLIASNDNWMDAPNRQEIIDSTIAPTNDLESAILTTLPANGTGYTAIVRGAGGGTGVGLVEVYDLDRTANSNLANISSRGFVQTGDNVMIGGFILTGTGTRKVIVRAIGPSLPVPGALADPTLELVNANGMTIAMNDNWRSDQEAEIIASTVAPTNDLESAIVATLPPTAHTAILRGKNGTTGVALVEVFALP